MNTFFKNISTLLLDLIFPPLCLKCRKFGTLLCKKCNATLAFSPTIVEPSVENCAVDEIRCISPFDSVVKSAIIQLKYNSVKDISELLGTWLYENSPLPIIDFITAVPLHPSRKKERGFNQAELIGKQLSNLTRKLYIELLQKNKATSSQAKTTSREQRFSQLKSAFSIHPNLSEPTDFLKGKSILIIDDVVTTGSTFHECALVLKAAGCSQVSGLAVAHGSQV